MHIPRRAPGAPIVLAQVTDLHLGEQENGELVGMNTDHSLGHVLALVAAELPELDLLLVTGDITDNGNVAGYSRAMARLGALGVPQVWLPGNHDDWAHMEQAVDGGGHLSRCIDLGAWQVLMLDSTVYGEVGGAFAQSELDFLEQRLAAAAGRHTLVALHHHPVPIGCDWLDQQQVANADAFWAVVDRHPGVAAVIWGHVHQVFESVRGGVRLMSAPSTCIQFAPNSPGFRLDAAAPGYRWFRLHDDGRLETGISRVQGVEFHVDFSSQGY